MTNRKKSLILDSDTETEQDEIKDEQKNEMKSSLSRTNSIANMFKSMNFAKRRVSESSEASNNLRASRKKEGGYTLPGAKI